MMTYLGFLNNEKVRGIPNETFSLVITSTVVNFNVSRVLNDGGGSYNIMYLDLFKRLWLKKRNCEPMKDPTYKPCDDTVTHPWGYVKPMVTL